jgi:hypothetical protein
MIDFAAIYGVPGASDKPAVTTARPPKVSKWRAQQLPEFYRDMLTRSAMVDRTTPVADSAERTKDLDSVIRAVMRANPKAYRADVLAAAGIDPAEAEGDLS